MKKIIFLIIILSLLFGIVSFAQETGLPNPGLTPDSPFYFFDTLEEKIGLFFTFGAEKKAEKALRYAEEKLAEAKIMAENNKIKALEKANKKYQDYLGLANEKVKEVKEKGKDVERLVTLIAEKTLKHQEILLEVYEKVPQEAKSGIEKAIEMSEKGFKEAVEAVSGEKKEELQQKAEEIKVKVEIAHWKTYINEKYGYSFKYPPECRYGSMLPYCKQGPPEERPPECLCFLDGENPDEVFLQAFTGKKDNLTLATLSVTHSDTSWHNPPPGTDLIEWLKEKLRDSEDLPDKPNMEINGIPAVRVYLPGSYMAPSGERIYYIKNDKLFIISMIDVDSESNKKLYNQILSTFKFVELEETKEEVPKVEEVPEVGEKPYIKVVSPNGGEVLKEGQDYTIRWESAGLKEEEEIHITIWREDGLNGKIATVPASQNFYLWKVETELENWAFGYFKNWVNKLLASLYRIFLASEQTLSYKYKITIYASKSGVSDQSDDYFTVTKRAAPDLTLGEELYQAGEGFAITICNKGNKDFYESNKRIGAKIEASLPPWSTRTFTPVTKILQIIDANLKVGECKQGTVIPYSEFNLQEGLSYELEVEVDPNDEFDELTEGAGRVYHFTVPEPKITVISPNGGEVWKVGNTYTIFWKATVPTGWLTKVNIKLLSQHKDDPSSYYVRSIASEVDVTKGFYSWYVPREISGIILSDYPCHKIEVVDSRYGRDSVVAKVFSDESDGCFRIIKEEEVCSIPQTPVLTDPGISVNSGESFTLNWTSVGGAKGYWYQSGYGSPVFEGSAYYTKLNSITQTIGASATFYYRVKACNDCGCSSWSNVVDIRVIVAPFIRITSPNGGERWVVGQTYNIEWQFHRLEKVTIDLFAYNAEGQVIKGFQYFIAESVDATKLYYKWTIPEIGDYPNYKLRIYNKLCIGGDELLAECLKDQYFDESDNYFSIVQPFVTVTSPNGGEVWAEGVTHHIKWDSAGVISVQIRCLVEYGDGNSKKFSVVQLAKNLGYYDWTIPDLSTKFEYKYKIWVGDPDGLVSDWSNGYFQIGPSPPPEP